MGDFMADTTEIQMAIDSLGETPEIDRVLLLIDKITAVKQWLKEAEPVVKRYLIDRCAKAPVPVGDGKEWHHTRDKKVSCPDKRKTFETMLDVFAGDVEKIVDCMASDPFKYGALKRALEEAGRPELYGQLFVEQWKEDCTLKLVDTKFLKQTA